MCYYMLTDNVVKVSHSFNHVQNMSRGFKIASTKIFIVSESKLL